MLIIYHDSSIFKNNENCILDVDAGFTEFGIPDTDYARKVLYEIDHAEYRSKSSFVDRYGLALPWWALSTSSKALLLIGMCKDKIVNCSEMGTNCGELLLENTSGSVFLYPRQLLKMGFGADEIEIDVLLNGRRFYSNLDLQLYIEEELVL